MKNLKFLFTIQAFLLSIGLVYGQNCVPADCLTKAERGSTEGISEEMYASLEPSFLIPIEPERFAKTATFTFPAGKVIEVALIRIKKGQESVLGQDYFPKVFPVAQEYGLSASQMFTVVEHAYGKAPVQQFGFFVWDSYAQKEAFDQDPRYLELRNIRNKALEYLYMGYFQVDQDVTYTFDDQSVYDFAAMWLDPQNADKLPKYFEKVAPVAMGAEYGYEPIVTLNPLKNCTKGKYTPNFIGFAKWKVPNGFQKLQSNGTYQKYVHLRDAATPYKDVFMVKANIQ